MLMSEDLVTECIEGWGKGYHIISSLCPKGQRMLDGEIGLQADIIIKFCFVVIVCF